MALVFCPAPAVSHQPPIPNSKPRRGKPPTKKKKIEGQTVVSEPDSCPEATPTKTFKKSPSDETAGILSCSKSELATLTNSKPCRGKPHTKKRKLEGADPGVTGEDFLQRRRNSIGRHRLVNLTPA
ncbi:hypothetical protein BC332_16786 [Capsicum chinense]|nr:hypothetical protein BC332_16786 [Capsicum chinense]